MIQKKLKHKFGAVACQRNGIKFPSKLERACYDVIQDLIKRKKLRMVLRQVSFDLPGKFKHVVDFCVFTGKEALFIEAKGLDLQVGKIKRKQAETLYDVDIHVVKSASELSKLLDKFN